MRRTARPARARTNRLARAAVWLALALLAWVPGLSAAQGTGDAPPSPSAPIAAPASRQADLVFVITIQGEITQVTEHSLRRRLAEADRRGAGAVVLELDTPGGDAFATLRMCSEIKNGPIATTVAWVNPDAYSAGAYLALACDEIVTAPYASMGDAAPVAFGMGGMQSLGQTERQKILAPFLAEVINSARAHGYDEKLVQGFVDLGVELWLVEDTRTGARYFIDENEWRVLFDTQPPRVSPRFGAGSSGGARTSEALPPPGASNTAVKGLPAEVESAVDQNLSESSLRPQFSAADAGQFRLIEYTTDGTTLLVFKPDDMTRYGLSAGVIRNDEELRAFFGAKELVRLDMSWSEHLVAFLSQMWVKGALVAIFLIAMFTEMVAPGVGVPGAIAGAALLALLAPPLLIGAAGWWTVAAVFAGIGLLAIELFVIPGATVFGVAGVLALLAGLVGSFVNPGSMRMGDQVVHGLAITLLACFVAGVAMYFIGRVYGSIPVLNRLVLTNSNERDDDASPSMLAAMAREAADDATALVRTGDVGVTTTPLRPAGAAEFGDHLVDVVSETGFADRGQRVRVISVTKYRVAVEVLDDNDAQAEERPA
ncbi:MAG: NfeD family protein [Phycisphaerales bacterium]